ncbi:hypothetical protein [Halococcus sp. IIIV-5B]|uniref:hypothetical protein n=1 Tax=Halococcus sp. IIIV-5B TaxID=2321230 RepID=UPI0011C4474A|nr:hypothetical protein [Halococcus sp. IIIV-5B]
MSKTGSSVTEFDWLTESILKELRSGEGEATTSDLRELTGVGKGTKINYRIDNKLEPQGFVETEQPDAKPGKIPPKKVVLTSRGEGLADQLLDAGDSDDLSISAELDQLRASVNKLESTVESQSETITNQTETIEAQEDEIQDLKQRYNELAQWVNEQSSGDVATGD